MRLAHEQTLSAQDKYQQSVDFLSLDLYKVDAICGFARIENFDSTGYKGGAKYGFGLRGDL